MVVIHSNGMDDLQQGRLSQDDAEPKTPNTRALAVSASAEKAKPSNTPPKLLDVRMVSVAGGSRWKRARGSHWGTGKVLFINPSTVSPVVLSLWNCQPV